MHLSSAVSWTLERISWSVCVWARQACWHQRHSGKWLSLALQWRLPAGLSSTVAATWGIAGTWRKGWKIKSETRGEPGCASKVCTPQTPENKRFTHTHTQTRKCILAAKYKCVCVWVLNVYPFLLLFFFCCCFERNVLSPFKHCTVDRRVLNKASPSKT